MVLRLAYGLTLALVISVISCEPIDRTEEESSSSSSSSSSSALTTELNVYQALPTHPGYIGTRIQSNAACESEYTTNQVAWGISCTNFVALLGYTSDSGVQDLASDFSIPSSVPVKTIDGDTFSSSLTNLINSGPAITLSLSDTGIHDVEAMTGFTNGGTVDSNCSDWSSGATAATFTGIDVSASGANWDDIVAGDCTTEIKPFFCLCW